MKIIGKIVLGLAYAAGFVVGFIENSIRLIEHHLNS